MTRDRRAEIRTRPEMLKEPGTRSSAAARCRRHAEPRCATHTECGAGATRRPRRTRSPTRRARPHPGCLQGRPQLSVPSHQRATEYAQFDLEGGACRLRAVSRCGEAGNTRSTPLPDTSAATSWSTRNAAVQRHAPGTAGTSRSHLYTSLSRKRLPMTSLATSTSSTMPTQRPGQRGSIDSGQKRSQR